MLNARPFFCYNDYMDRILVKRTEMLNLSTGKMRIAEPSAYIADLVLDILKSGDAVRFEELKDIFRAWAVGNFEWPMPADDFAKVVGCIARLASCEGVLSCEKSASKHDDFSDFCPDASVFVMLDLVCSHYGGSPFEMYKTLSYRQIMYAYAMAYNARIDEITMHGGKGKDGKPLNKMYVGGLSLDHASMSQKDKMAYYAKMANRLRSERNGG